MSVPNCCSVNTCGSGGKGIVVVLYDDKQAGAEQFQ
jgi:hypothetical protein